MEVSVNGRGCLDLITKQNILKQELAWGLPDSVSLTSLMKIWKKTSKCSHSINSMQEPVILSPQKIKRKMYRVHRTVKENTETFNKDIPVLMYNINKII